MATQLSIMSFNIRYDNPGDGQNRFSLRQPRIVEFLNKTSPDIIGFQEILPAMRKWLVEAFPDYYMVGIGRGKRYDDETALIAFRKDKMSLISCDTVMLSTCPTKFGTTYEASGQSQNPREYVRALIKHHDVAEPFYVYNVHTDYASPIPRMLAATQMLQHMTSHNYKLFWTGDFNSAPETPEMNMITACSLRPLKDATAGLGPTSHVYGSCFGEKGPTRIDYIFTDTDTPVLQSTRHIVPPVDGTYISDHYPVSIVVEL